ncbi:hypothetical protein CYMTET_25195 [Cymbomonas tetramitiformis]|uniref:Uncharacterized protein n=1 Tax=Cymbomonas tetramitiformis TaxID=36881 RepID=A0AAE0KZ69_9CHLO|nr:hypothetical protein CYMTET_25195 [Cymbomonas tetramitiformis]
MASAASAGVEPVRTVSASRAKILKTVEGGDADGQYVTTGCLLKLMDICACLAAENHCCCSCVTISLDDLSVENEVPIGSLLEIVGQVNNAFNTSMEIGVVVHMESLTTGHRAVICNAFFVFVALDDAGKKKRVPPVLPETVEERHTFRLAEERRAVRLKKRALLQSLTKPSGTATLTRRPSLLAAALSAAEIPADELELTQPQVHYLSETVYELVLPSHANHHGNTFGGQIMEWMAKVAGVVGSRQILSVVRAASANASGASAQKPFARATVSSVDALIFEGPSRSGDRVVLHARVTACFTDSLELELRVEARGVDSGDGLRRINTGFLTVSAFDDAGDPFAIPALQEPWANSAEMAMHSEAVARRFVRESLQRMFAFRAQPVAYHAELSEQLSITNIYGLLRAAHTDAITWQCLMDVKPGQVVGWSRSPCAARVFFNRDTWGLGLVSFMYRVVCPAPMETVFQAIDGLERRAEWDLVLREGEVVQPIDEHNAIVHEVFEALTSDTPHDYALLRSWRKVDESIVIATRSIVHEDVPVYSGYERGTVLPSGFILCPQADGSGTDAFKRFSTNFAIGSC